MEKLDLRQVIESKSPGYLERYPKIISNLIVNLLTRILQLNQINAFIEKNVDKRGFEFIDELFDHLDFSYLVSSQDRLKIPSEGRLICVANHPLGALDGLVLIKAISSIRPDVKIVANDILMNLENLKDLFLPYDIFSPTAQRSRLAGIKNALLNDETVIFFPAAEVSRLTIRGIRDRKWLKGPLYFAHKYQAPILPIYVKARNSILFYAVSLLAKSFSMFMLPREILRKGRRAVQLKVGDPIPNQNFKTKTINLKVQTRLLKRHVYRLAKHKKGIFKTEKTIIHPVDRKLLKSDLASAELLSQVAEAKKLYLTDFKSTTHIMREIFRLREVTFRKVGEGTGNKYDFDQFDKWYKHIVLWDEESLDIVGSYRLGLCREIIANHGIKGIYNASLYQFSEAFHPILDKAVELGRSFIQQKYWRSNALDYLWQGIGSFLMRHPDIRYLFGAVSISDYYSADAKSMIVYFYKKWFGGDEKLVTADHPFIMTRQQEDEAAQIFNNDDYNQDFRTLKTMLKNIGYSIPVLFRRYSELCEPNGVKFLAFGVDESFSNVVDGLVLLDMSMLKESKRQRYYQTAE
ncbi:MAG: lysophospholipid acyltransferase family protein [bacterium]|nr:lysophospholipid acyltransferase family protein [bacterium]